MGRRPRWTPPRFANLREFIQWFADWGDKTTCCQRATPEELRAAPERYDCRRCELVKHRAQLWSVNAEAWRIYQVLCGRTVREGSLVGIILDRMTAGWTADELTDLLARLDLIQDVLNPEGRHGRAGAEAGHSR